ncbi:MAG: hypothetical protein KGP01_05205, partial [Actinomycetales bacterium]|nr:hypothetical protein [Actinomycetales bacterium]
MAAHVVDRARLAELVQVEREFHAQRHPKCREAFRAADHLFGRVPMTWMSRWSGNFPMYLGRAHGSEITCIDGHTHIDFALGDTGAMAGHSPAAI